MAFLSLASLLGITAQIQRRGQLGFAHAFSCAIGLVLAALYVASLLGILWYGAAALLLVGLALGGLAVVQAVRERKRPGSSGYYVVIAACIGFFVLHRNSSFYRFDEFAHWGIFLRDLVHSHALWGAASNSMHPHYLPGTPLWQYWFCAFTGFADANAYFAQFLLLLAPILILCDLARKQAIGWLLAILSLCIFLLASFSNGLASLYVDHIVALWIAAILVVIVRQPLLERTNLMLLAVLLIPLALFKGIGIAFVLVISFTAAGLLILESHQQPVAARIRHVLLLLAVVLAPSLCMRVAWSVNRRAAETPRSQQSLATVVRAAVQGEENVAPYGDEIRRRFWQVVTSQGICRSPVSERLHSFTYPAMPLYQDPMRLSTLGLLVGFLLWQGLVLAATVGKTRWRWLVAACGMFAGSVAYLAFLYVNYRYCLGDYGLQLSSFIRYMSVAAVPLMVLCVAPLIPQETRTARVLTIRERTFPVPALLLAFGALYLAVYETPYLRPLARPNPAVPLRETMTPFCAKVCELVGDAPVCVVLPTDRSEQLGRLILFLLSPTHARGDWDPNALDTSDLTRWEAYEYLWFPQASRKLDSFLHQHATGPSRYRLFRRTGTGPDAKLAPVE